MNAFATLALKDILIADSLDDYNQGIDFFNSQLVQLNTTIFIIEKIIEVPFIFFAERDKTTFLQAVIDNFFDAGLLTITRLATDQEGDLYTLPRFKNEVRKFVKDELKSQFDAILKEKKFDKKTRDLLGRAKNLRNERIAHLNRNVALGISEGADLHFTELKSLCDSLNSLFDVLAFNALRSKLPMAYDPETRIYDLDIDEILDFVIMQSPLLNMPEKDPTTWQYRRLDLTKDEIETINKYRKKFNLAEI